MTNVDNVQYMIRGLGNISVDEVDDNETEVDIEVTETKGITNAPEKEPKTDVFLRVDEKIIQLGHH